MLTGKNRNQIKSRNFQKVKEKRENNNQRLKNKKTEKN